MSLNRKCAYPSESLEYTALQYASVKGSVDEVRYLLESGADIDAGPDPALHLTLRKGHASVAYHLLQSGAEFDVKDSHGDYPIHIACSLGMLDIVHTLCTLGCSLEVPNAKGLFPLHLAAKYGFIDIIRCLSTSGCNIEVKNADNIRADITALRYGNNDIAELLDRLRITGNRDLFARQLVPTSKPVSRICLKVLGNCGVGKSALIKSLTAGLFSSLFRRSSSLQSNKSRPSSPTTTQIEMDVTSRQNSLNFESTGNYQSTNGIHMQNVDISGVGEISVWEFSGQENYFPSYHHFLKPSSHAITAILFSLEELANVQIQQVSFWVNFLLARQIADLPTCEYGKIILIATHVDSTRAVKNMQSEWISLDAQKTAETICKLIPHAPNLCATPIVMDCNVSASYAFKQLKSLLSSVKQNCIQQTIGTWTGLLDATISWLTGLQKCHEQFPVLSRNTFTKLVQSQVNVLASEEHIAELLSQLHFMGEVCCIEDLVVISVPWIGSYVIGELLSSQSHICTRVTGVYSVDDFQATYNQCDALGSLELLKSLDFCVQCDVDGETEFEFPIFNQIETLEGLWDAADPRYRTTGASYGGVRLFTAPGTCHLFSSIFAYIQVCLRKATLDCADSDIDLYQWYRGSKLCTTTLETLVTLEGEETGSEFLEVKSRGPRQTSVYCFKFLENILQLIYKSVFKICPGLILERHVISTHQLRVHHSNPFIYEPHVIMSSMLNAESTLDVTLTNGNTNRSETLVQLVLFDNEQISSNIQWGCALKVETLLPAVKLKLCGLLDPPHSHGRDWCLLALRLGLSQERIATLESNHTSSTMRLLSIADCTIGALISSLHELDRSDAAEVVLRSAPLLQIVGTLA